VETERKTHRYQGNESWKRREYAGSGTPLADSTVASLEERYWVE
jgi:hypothetical protein